MPKKNPETEAREDEATGHEPSSEGSRDSEPDPCGAGKSEEELDKKPETDQVRIGLWDFCQCDISKCSGRKLLRFKYAKRLEHDKRYSRRWSGIILSPRAKKKLSLEDKDIVSKGGIGVIDCSWNKIEEIPFHKIHNGNERLLPFLVATNSTHYGRPYELSCAEAISSCLYLLGYESQAKKVLGIFKGGLHFFELNKEVFSLYKKHGYNHNCVVSIENEYLDKYHSDKKNKEKRDYNSLFSSMDELSDEDNSVGSEGLCQ
ncbi:Yor006cp-like protein [Cryptosporidium ryanae]|uniref:Yor006cp-like protein n=1 Tax=Cryptosporidium ryanae TaxID=515981 RepID=UPI00351A4595|nr:Yor006cp-like protein [Cryptosporidium ryanae]